MGHFKFLCFVCAYKSFMSQVIVEGATALGQFGNKLAATLNTLCLSENRVFVGYGMKVAKNSPNCWGGLSQSTTGDFTLRTVLGYRIQKQITIDPQSEMQLRFFPEFGFKIWMTQSLCWTFPAYVTYVGMVTNSIPCYSQKCLL